MKILHLITDHQVVERTLSVYEETFPGQNEVLVFNNDSKFKRLKNDYQGKVVNCDNLKTIASNYDFSSITHVVAHYLTFDKIDFIRFVPAGIHVCWEIYGADLYNQFLQPLGYKLQYVNPSDYNSRKVAFLKRVGLFNICYAIRFQTLSEFPFKRKQYFKYITNRIDSVAVCCQGDADILEQYSGRRIQTYRAFNYSLQQTLGELMQSAFSLGDGLLIGNSASLTNNHLYVLSLIKDYDIDCNKIIIPVSYGGKKKYIDEVIKQYNGAFADRVSFLTDYIPLSEYNKIFLQIKIMILASWRQESIGTIFMGLYLGIKIYMSDKSPLYHSLKNEGFVIFEIEKAHSDSFSMGLTSEQKELNRSLLLKKYGEGVFESELEKQYCN